MLRKIKLGLRELDSRLKAQKAKEIISRLESNPMFPTPEPALLEIMELVDMMELKSREIELERERAHKISIEAKKTESELDKKLWQLAMYVENAAKGNKELIKKAGLDVRADPKPLGIPGKVTLLSLKETGLPGELKLVWSRIPGARVYNVELRANKNLRWQLYDSTTRTRTVIEHLRSGNQYHFRVQAVGSAGKGEFSEETIRYAP